MDATTERGNVMATLGKHSTQPDTKATVAKTVLAVLIAFDAFGVVYNLDEGSQLAAMGLIAAPVLTGVTALCLHLADR